jgi:hypothetical protein
LSNYTITYDTTGTLTVNPAPLTISSNNLSKTYGQTTTFTGTEFTPTGLLNSDSVSSVTLTSPGTAPTATVAGGPYAITPSAAVGSGLSNYTITYNSTGLLTVNPAVLNIDSTNLSKTYGQTGTFTGTEFTTSGLLNSDSVSSVTLTSPGTAPTATVAGGPYAITPSAAVGSGLSNYTITYNSTGLLTVNPAALSINSTNVSKTYGQTGTFTGTEFTTSGLLNSDSVSSVTLTSPGTAPTATVAGGPYAITPSAAVGTGLSNYTISYNSTGLLTVAPAPLTIKADDVTKTYGQTTTFTGTEFSIVLPTQLFNSDSITSVTLTSPGAASTAGVAGSPYAITPSNAVGTGLSNYTITYDTSGALTVNTLPITITSLSQTKNEGTSLSPTTSAFITNIILPNSETIGTVDISSAGLDGSAPAGNYPITNVTNAAGGTFDPANYSISYVADGNIIVSSPIPIIPVATNVPPTEIFTPPEGPGCGAAGCDNYQIILFDPLNGLGIPDDIIVYPVGVMPEMVPPSDNSDILGVVTESSGPPSEAINGQGIARTLNVGDVIYKEDTVIAGGTSCVCMETNSHEKKCTSDTKHTVAWSNVCKTTTFNKINKSPKTTTNHMPQRTLTDVLDQMREKIRGIGL